MTDYSGLKFQLEKCAIMLDRTGWEGTWADQRALNDYADELRRAAAALEEMAWLEWALEHGWRLLFEPDFDRYGLLSPDGVVFNGVLLGEAIQKARESEK